MGVLDLYIFLSANLFAVERLTLSLSRVLNFFQVVSDFRFHKMGAIARSILCAHIIFIQHKYVEKLTQYVLNKTSTLHKTSSLFATNGFHGKQLVSMVNCDDIFYSVARAY